MQVFEVLSLRILVWESTGSHSTLYLPLVCLRSKTSTHHPNNSWMTNCPLLKNWLLNLRPGGGTAGKSVHSVDEGDGFLSTWQIKKNRWSSSSENIVVNFRFETEELMHRSVDHVALTPRDARPNARAIESKRFVPRYQIWAEILNLIRHLMLWMLSLEYIRKLTRYLTDSLLDPSQELWFEQELWRCDYRPVRRGILWIYQRHRHRHRLFDVVVFEDKRTFWSPHDIVDCDTMRILWRLWLFILRESVTSDQIMLLSLWNIGTLIPKHKSSRFRSADAGSRSRNLESFVPLLFCGNHCGSSLPLDE